MENVFEKDNNSVNVLKRDKEHANIIVNEIFDKYESNSYMYQKINTIYRSELFHQINTIESKPKISSFIAYTAPSASLNLPFSTKNKFFICILFSYCENIYGY